MVEGHSVTQVGPDVPMAAIEVVDPAVIARLPDDVQVISLKPHGFSFWTRTARLDTRLSSGSHVSYFLKTTSGELGRNMVHSEHTSMSMIHDLKPFLVPKPLAWGSYTTIPDVHFLLCEFRPMKNELPEDIDGLAKAVAEFHKASLGNQTRISAPADKKYGFDLPTYHGNVPIHHGWANTWEGYFARTTRHLLSMELESRGPWGAITLQKDDMASGGGGGGRGGPSEIEDLDQDIIIDLFFNRVVPRLLRPLEANISPVLIHGDLWHGNAGVDSSTDQAVIFDAASFWAHNEYELAVWRQPWNQISNGHRLCYHRYFPQSEPAGEYDDRNLLYSTRVNILDSILYKDDPSYRTSYMFAMRGLVDKFSGEVATPA
ncbi:Fructosamine kinase-domain-containing protein [Microdochium trichocladiopsis]|uniref:protein-ribulosamine 3-kinase n=1 Tax=Microdochium trichocladiopsis TaxID=1682393 RepID=A0A9P9BUA0_9PEZI|nr:Fructosamine kinase-domain-containing protein [Microdochium trichocladiopsis]KAH7031249.1 Fructosamine kinase-domain-containing protein [Microdochium trichocladiopsis]